jgi:hypothetical protein
MLHLDLADVRSVATFAAAARALTTTAHRRRSNNTNRLANGDGRSLVAAAAAPLGDVTGQLGGRSAAAGEEGAGAAPLDLLVLCAGVAGKPFKLSPQVFESVCSADSALNIACLRVMTWCCTGPLHHEHQATTVSLTTLQRAFCGIGMQQVQSC